MGLKNKILSRVIDNSQYIKEYSKETYDRILKEHKKESIKLGLLKRLNRKLFKKYVYINSAEIKNIYQTGIVSKVLEFAKIDYDQYLQYSSLTHDFERFESQEESDNYWFKVDEKWLCKNISLQLHDYAIIFNAVDKLLEGKDSTRLTMCDYACSTAALTMTLNNKFKFKQVDLYDIENYASEYVHYAIKENHFDNINWYNIIDEKVDKQYDLVICLDVLEHLDNSFEILKRLTEKTKKGGHLILKIAFECKNPTHLPSAAKNFFIENDGMEYLKTNFKQVMRFQQDTIINGVYEKI